MDEEAVEQLEEVLEVAEFGERKKVTGERLGMALVHAERGGIEALPIGLARSARFVISFKARSVRDECSQESFQLIKACSIN